MKKIIFTLVTVICAASLVFSSCGNKADENTSENGGNTKENKSFFDFGSDEKEDEKEENKVEIPKVEVIDFTGVEPAPESDFTFRIDNEGYVWISRYKGNAEIVVIPDTFKGQPVKGGGIVFNGSTKLIPNETVRGVKIPEGFEYISSSSFEGCTNLITVEIPETVTEISDRAFFNCGLTSIDLPDSLEKIGRQAFMYNEFYEVTIPKNVRLIGQNAFDCPNLVNVVIEDGDVEMKIVSGGIRSIANSIIIPDRVTEIDEYGIHLSDGAKIYCHAGSAAEEHAKLKEYEYEIIE